MKIILASSSPRRKELLCSIGLKFDIIPSNIDEDIKEEKPEELVKKLSYLKARYISKIIKDEAIIIGADTIVFLDGQIICKPRNKEEAFNMLKKLQGNIHEVYTGLTLINTLTGKSITEYEKTSVKIKDMNDDEINRYINTGEPYDKAGAYAIQGKGSLIVEYINGDYFNVVGLPINKLNMIINEFGINLL